MLSRHHGTTGPASSELAIRLGLLPRLLGEESKGMVGFPWEDVAQKTYDEFAKWCEDASKDLQFAIKTGKGNMADLEATIQKESASSDASKAKIDNAGSALRNEKINCH